VITLHLRNGQFSCQEYTMTMSLEKVLYTGKAHTTGGRSGASRSSDGRLDIKLSSPGTPGNGTNPEQLFAAGWSVCFMGAMGLAAAKMRTRLPANAAVDAEVDLCDNDGEYFPKARLNVSLPGIGREVAQTWVDAAHLTCPYSKATRGNWTSLSAWREPKRATTRRSYSPPGPAASSAKDNPTTMTNVKEDRHALSAP
jgi:osmotically inducible protein OsmC